MTKVSKFSTLFESFSKISLTFSPVESCVRIEISSFDRPRGCPPFVQSVHLFVKLFLLGVDNHFYLWYIIGMTLAVRTRSTLKEPRPTLKEPRPTPRGFITSRPARSVQSYPPQPCSRRLYRLMSVVRGSDIFDPDFALTEALSVGPRPAVRAAFLTVRKKHLPLWQRQNGSDKMTVTKWHLTTGLWRDVASQFDSADASRSRKTRCGVRSQPGTGPVSPFIHRWRRFVMSRSTKERVQTPPVKPLMKRLRRRVAVELLLGAEFLEQLSHRFEALNPATVCDFRYYCGPWDCWMPEEEQYKCCIK